MEAERLRAGGSSIGILGAKEAGEHARRLSGQAVQFAADARQEIPPAGCDALAASGLTAHAVAPRQDRLVAVYRRRCLLLLLEAGIGVRSIVSGQTEGTPRAEGAEGSQGSETRRIVPGIAEGLKSRKVLKNSARMEGSSGLLYLEETSFGGRMFGTFGQIADGVFTDGRDVLGRFFEGPRRFLDAVPRLFRRPPRLSRKLLQSGRVEETVFARLPGSVRQLLFGL